jgi:hypothetical protein
VRSSTCGRGVGSPSSAIREAFGGGDQRDQIVALGVRYHLLTPYTSFVAVDPVRRRGGPDLVTVRQPVPLPEGVSRMALEAGESMQPRRMLGHIDNYRR